MYKHILRIHMRVRKNSVYVLTMIFIDIYIYKSVYWFAAL